MPFVRWGSQITLVETVMPGQTHIQLTECFLKSMGNNGIVLFSTDVQ